MLNEFIREAKKGEESFAALCERFGISRKTGYKWLNRFRDWGEAGLRARSRRPRSSPQQIPAEVVEAVVSLRRREPDWPAARLREALGAEGWEPLPAASTIDLLLRRRRNAVAQREVRLAAARQGGAQRPNARWRLHAGRIEESEREPYPILVLLVDEATDFHLGAARVASESELVRWLAGVFERKGMPAAMCIPGADTEGRLGAGAEHSAISRWLMELEIWVGLRAGVTIAKRPAVPTMPAYQRNVLAELTADPAAVLSKVTRGLGDIAAAAALATACERHNAGEGRSAVAAAIPAARYQRSEREFDPTAPTGGHGPEGWTVVVDATGRVAIGEGVVQLAKCFSGCEIELRAEAGRDVTMYYLGQPIGVAALAKETVASAICHQNVK